MRKEYAESLAAVHIHTGILLNKNKLYNREYINLKKNEGLLSEPKKYRNNKKDSNAIFVSILDTG